MGCAGPRVCLATSHTSSLASGSPGAGGYPFRVSLGGQAYSGSLGPSGTSVLFPTVRTCYNGPCIVFPLGCLLLEGGGVGGGHPA